MEGLSGYQGIVASEKPLLLVSLSLSRGKEKAVNFTDRLIKRSFDLIVSLIGLVLLLPVIIVAWLVAAIETGANGFFIQERVGRNGDLFNVYKIKTMKKVEGIDTTITQANDARITKSG